MSRADQLSALKVNLQEFVDAISNLKRQLEILDMVEDEVPDSVGVILDRAEAALGLGCDLVCDARDESDSLWRLLKESSK